jgi:short-subunit dehydrogenase
MELEGSVVLVTGASSGIGLEVARALAREGAQVALAARSREKLEAAVTGIASEGGTAMAVPLDVTSNESVAAGIRAVVDRFGRLDVVINNAGNGGALALWANTSADQTRAMFDVHVLGAERVIRGVLPTMLQQGAGIVINVVSTVAWVPMPGAAAYSAAKAALVALSGVLRAELAARGIDVRVFAPPHTSTDAGKAWPLDLPKIFAPEWVAAELVRALRRGRPRVVAGGNSALLWVQRISPALAARIMNGLGFKAVATLEASQRSLTAAG